jgi:hypothetical protein
VADTGPNLPSGMESRRLTTQMGGYLCTGGRPAAAAEWVSQPIWYAKHAIRTLSARHARAWGPRLARADVPRGQGVVECSGAWTPRLDARTDLYVGQFRWRLSRDALGTGWQGGVLVAEDDAWPGRRWSCVASRGCVVALVVIDGPGEGGDGHGQNCRRNRSTYWSGRW